MGFFGCFFFSKSIFIRSSADDVKGDFANIFVNTKLRESNRFQYWKPTSSRVFSASAFEVTVLKPERDFGSVFVDVTAQIAHSGIGQIVKTDPESGLLFLQSKGRSRQSKYRGRGA